MLSIGGRLQENNKNKAYDGSEDRDELADALERVFHQVRESLIAHENGFVSAGPFAIDKHGMGKRAHYGLKLYDGLSGIALFIAAYSFASKNTEARDLAVPLVGSVVLRRIHRDVLPVPRSRHGVPQQGEPRRAHARAGQRVRGVAERLQQACRVPVTFLERKASHLPGSIGQVGHDIEANDPLEQ